VVSTVGQNSGGKYGKEGAGGKNGGK